MGKIQSKSFKTLLKLILQTKLKKVKNNPNEKYSIFYKKSM